MRSRVAPSGSRAPGGPGSYSGWTAFQCLDTTIDDLTWGVGRGVGLMVGAPLFFPSGKGFPRGDFEPACQLSFYIYI